MDLEKSVFEIVIMLEFIKYSCWEKLSFLENEFTLGVENKWSVIK